MAAVRQLRRGGASVAAQLREYHPFLLRVAVLSGLQGIKAKVPLPQFFESLLVVEVPEMSVAVFMVHNIIRGAHSFWP